MRWGVVGPGNIGTAFVESLAASTDQKVVAVASRRLLRAQEFAAAHGIPTAYGEYAQLMADPGVDIVYISAPHTEHAPLALQAIAAGKHVLIEKPIATTVADARAIAAAARAAGVFAMEAMWSRYLPQTTILARLLADGELGDVKLATSDFGFNAPFDPKARHFDPALAGGALLDLGVYAVWFTNLVLGAPKTVNATGSLAPTGVDQQATITMTYEGDAIALASCSLLADTTVTASVSGTVARVEVAAPFLSPTSLLVSQNGRDPLEWVDDSGLTWSQGLCYQAVAAAQYIADGRTDSPLHGLDDAIAVLAVLEEARAQLGSL